MQPIVYIIEGIDEKEERKGKENFTRYFCHQLYLIALHSIKIFRRNRVSHFSVKLKSFSAGEGGEALFARSCKLHVSQPPADDIVRTIVSNRHCSAANRNQRSINRPLIQLVRLYTRWKTELTRRLSVN